MLRFFSYVLVLGLGVVVGALGGGLIGEVGGSAIGGIGAVCRTIDTAVNQKLMTQEQANTLASSLVAQLGLDKADLKAAMAKFGPPEEKTACAIAAETL